MTEEPAATANRAPDVSVIMPAWNAASVINGAIDSVLKSEGVSIELVIVDDASTDGTYETLEHRANGDDRIRIDRLKTNGGPSAARNRAIELAKGRYIAVVDSDDAIAVSRLKKLVTLADTSNADIVVDNMLEVDAWGDRLGDGGFLRSPAFSGPRDITLADYVRYNHPMKDGDCLGYLKPMFRRATLTKLNARYDEDLRNSEDYYLVAHLLAQGARMTYTPFTGYFYRRAEGSTSHRLKAAQTAAWLVAEQAFTTRYVEAADESGSGALLDEAARRQLKARSRAIRNTDRYVRAIDAFKERRFTDLLRLLASDPRASIFTIGWFAKVAGQRVATFIASRRRIPRAAL